MRVICCSLLSLAVIGCSYYPFGTLPEDYVKQAAPGELRIGGWLSTAGPYGELWVILINENRAWVEANTSKHKIKLSDQALSEIKSAIIESDFYSLPESITEPLIPLHHPDFYLYVSMNGNYHWVNLYDPEALSDKAEAKRFMLLWNAIMKSLDLKPKLQSVQANKSLQPTPPAPLLSLALQFSKSIFEKQNINQL